MFGYLDKVYSEALRLSLFTEAISIGARAFVQQHCFEATATFPPGAERAARTALGCNDHPWGELNEKVAPVIPCWPAEICL